MIYELCSHAAGCVTDRNAVILPGKQKSLGEERRKKEPPNLVKLVEI